MSSAPGSGPRYRLGIDLGTTYTAAALSRPVDGGWGEPEIVAQLRDGIEGVERNFVGLLERNGIQRTDPTGQPFDANLHQAMQQQPSAEHPPGTVVQAWTSAWTLNGRLLRPAMVVVSAAPEGDAAAKPDAPA